MMNLKGSCHCGAVTFEVKSHTPQPYMRCYCSICRKTAGGGGYAINIMGEARTLKVRGRKHLGVYRATLEEGGVRMHSSARRHFCKHCGSALFIADPRWKKWVYPHASAIDTPLPVPVETAHIMLDSKCSWAEAPGGKRNRKFHEYPDQSIEDWHKTRGVYVK
ncbi:MAG TPA: GFA family protein [Dongiaceae bacterium]